MKKKALITGITGQDGSYLAELLLAKGYEVHGIIRRVALEDPQHRLWRVRNILDQLHFHPASLESYPSLYNVIKSVMPDEIYHLAAQSFVSYAFEDEFSTLTTNINGTHYLLSAVRDLCPGCRFYFAASSEMFGKVEESPQTERTMFHPRSAYGISKVAGFDLTRNYREAYSMLAVSGILYNHESPRRGYEFVTRKISHTAAQIKLGLAQKIRLGNLEARRDWGYAPKYVEAMWLINNHHSPEDFLIATNENHTVREFMDTAFKFLDLDYREYLETDKNLFRPAEIEVLQGNPAKAQRELKWEYNLKFTDLVSLMVRADYDYLKTGRWQMDKAVI
ncbi:MAG: GDP-mannose 4,6-dehydratase [Candidatus Schekmanbacteria bacterium]|nr:GDP-mannose 4,6-dehydratase [Candidatus Schekmanbacteria bacterium]